MTKIIKDSEFMIQVFTIIACGVNAGMQCFAFRSEAFLGLPTLNKRRQESELKKH